MGKIYVGDLATTLVAKHGLEKRAAQQFISALVDVVRDGIAADRQVKIKGLGTFKVVEVGARESMNVNTGERVMIDSHSKLTFTPDSTMKELVNKPFSQFETVVLNEGVTFDDMSESATEEPSSEEPTPGEPAVEQIPTEVVKEEPAESVAQEPVDEIKEEPVDEVNEEPVDEVKEDLVDEIMVDPVDEIKEEPVEVVDEEPAPTSRKKWLLWLPVVLLWSALCFGIGYWLGISKKPHTVIIPSKQSSEVANIDTARQNMDIRQSPLDSMSVSAPSADSIEVEQSEVEETEIKQPEVTETEATDDNARYEAMDNRVRLGAYHIVGLDHTVTVKEGETLYRISRRTLGQGMECYVEVYNGITKDTPLKVGQQLKIPKLKMKAAARKKLRR